MRFLNKKRTYDSDEPLSSELHTEHTFYDRFIDDMYAAKRTIYIESPFITTIRCRSLLPYFSELSAKGIRIYITTRNPSTHSSERELEAAAEIHYLTEVGVKVIYSSSKAHRKIVIIDDSILYEGSLNVLSHFKSEEIMRRLASEVLVKEMRKLLKI